MATVSHLGILDDFAHPRADSRTLAERPNRALQLIKEATDLAQDTPEDEAIHRTLSLSEAVFRTEDAKEGVRAFFAKEPPRWRHR